MGTLNQTTGCLNQQLRHIDGRSAVFWVERDRRLLLLSWTQQSDGWHANGYRIVLEAPRRWILTEEAPESMAALDSAIGYVSTPTEPLAQARTLTEAKREAELFDLAKHRAALRSRHTVILLVTLAIGILLWGGPPMQNLALLLVVAYFVLRSLGVIMGTILWRWAISARDAHFYQ